METEEAKEFVAEDVEQGVGRWLPRVADLEFGAAGNLEGTPFVAVQWVHRGRNEGTDDPFIGLAQTGTEVEVQGVTLVEDRGDEPPLFHRYVDWVGVYDQLGLAVNGRLPVSEHPGHIGPPPLPDP